MRRLNGEERIKTRFLFWPKSLRNEVDEWETRWLEKASWKETWYAYRLYWYSVDNRWFDA